MQHELLGKEANQQDVAELVGVTPATVTAWKKKGYLSFIHKNGKSNLVDQYSLLRYIGNGFEPDPDPIVNLFHDFEAWTAEERQDAEKWECEFGIRHQNRVELKQTDALEILQVKRDYLARRDSVMARCGDHIQLCAEGALELPAFAGWEVCTIYKTLRDARDMLKSQIHTLNAALEDVLGLGQCPTVPPACIQDVSPKSLVDQTANAPVPTNVEDTDEVKQCVRDSALDIMEVADEINDTFLDPGINK